jgi:anion-transporting  ArsA/GET3 family ATPase
MAIPVLDLLARRRFLVVTGKGGVGKTLVSALLGRILAAEGRRVLLLEVDPRANLHELAGTAPSAGDVVGVGPDLYLQNLQPRHVMEQVVRDHLRVELLVRRVVRSSIFQHFVDAAPGLKEVAVLGHAWRALHGHGPEAKLRLDVIILDAPATRHGVSMLTAPLVVDREAAGIVTGREEGLGRFVVSTMPVLGPGSAGLPRREGVSQGL